MSRPRSGVLAILAVIVGCVVAGCGIQPTGVVRGGFAVSVPGHRGGVELCLVRDGRLVTVDRLDVILDGEAVSRDIVGDVNDPAPEWPDLARLESLLALGPRPNEAETGLLTEVPASLRLQLIGSFGGMAVPDLKQEELEAESVPTPEKPESVPTPSPSDASTSLPVVVIDPVSRLSETAARQIDCTLELYLKKLDDDRDVVLLDVYAQMYGGSIGATEPG